MSIHVKMSPLARLRQRPLEHLLAVIFIHAASQRLAGPEGAFGQHLSGLTSALWSLAALLGAILILVGLHWRGDALVRAIVEQIGWYVAGLTAAAGPVLLLLGGYGWEQSFTDDMLIGVGAALRIWYLSVEHGAIKRIKLLQIEDARSSGGEGDDGG